MAILLSKRKIILGALLFTGSILALSVMIRLYYSMLTGSVVGTEQTDPCKPDERMCADGSIVFRVAPLCEFAECKDESSESSTDYQSWELYQNTANKFSLSYPSFWNVHELPGGVVEFTSNSFASVGPLRITPDTAYRATSSDALFETLVNEHDYTVTEVKRRDIGTYEGVELVPTIPETPDYTLYLVVSPTTTLLFKGENAHRSIISTIERLE